MNKVSKKDLNPKGDMLLPLMMRILNRCAPAVAVIVATLFVFGCSSVSGDPREEANQAVTDANEAISEHNELFNQSRDTYSSVKSELESGGDPSGQQERIADARATLEEARSNLESARDSLGGVQDLEVDPAIKEYAKTLSGAMNAQLTAEATEIEFYNTLEEDPALENNRQQALDLLSEADADYQKAEDRYAQARRIASQNPDLISLPSQSGTTVPETTMEETT